MMRLFITVIVLLLASVSHADLFVAAGNSWRFERDSEGIDYNKFNSLNLAAGITYPKLTFLFEYSNFRENSGEQRISISRRHQEFDLWGRWTPFGVLSWWPYIGLGFGLYKETVSFDFLNQRSEAEGGLQPQYALAGGIRQRLYQAVTFNGEGRIFYAPELQDEPIYSLLARLGYQF